MVYAHKHTHMHYTWVWVYECYIGFPCADPIVVYKYVCVKAMLLKLCCVGIMCTCCGRFTSTITITKQLNYAAAAAIAFASASCVVELSSLNANNISCCGPL